MINDSIDSTTECFVKKSATNIESTLEKYFENELYNDKILT